MEAVMTCQNCHVPLEWDVDELLHEEPRRCPRCSEAYFRRLSDHERASAFLIGWFLARYRRPSGICPYDKETRQFRFVFGGPYRPDEELYYHWGGVFTDAFLTGVGSYICAEHNCTEWSGPDERPFRENT